MAGLQAAGITYSVDEAQKSRGLLVIDLELTTEDGEKLALKARFPDLYPYFRFEILAPDLTLPPPAADKQAALYVRASYRELEYVGHSRSLYPPASARRAKFWAIDVLSRSSQH